MSLNSVFLSQAFIKKRDPAFPFILCHAFCPVLGAVAKGAHNRLEQGTMLLESEPDFMVFFLLLNSIEMSFLTNSPCSCTNAGTETREAAVWHCLGDGEGACSFG